MKWFDGVKNIEELRKRYRELLKEYHPDNENGSVEITQEINAEYDAIFTVLEQTDNSYTKKENEHFKAILNVITGFDITIEIIGSWIWCFNSFEYRKQLKELGFKWCNKKKAWIWHDEPYHRHHKEEIPLNHIRAKYGSEMIKNYMDKCSLSDRKVNV